MLPPASLSASTLLVCGCCDVGLKRRLAELLLDDDGFDGDGENVWVLESAFCDEYEGGESRSSMGTSISG